MMFDTPIPMIHKDAMTLPKRGQQKHSRASRRSGAKRFSNVPCRETKALKRQSMLVMHKSWIEKEAHKLFTISKVKDNTVEGKYFRGRKVYVFPIDRFLHEFEVDNG